MQVTDLASLLAFVAAGGAALTLPRFFERFAWFQSLAATGKQFTVAGSAIGVTLLAVAGQGLMVKYPMISAEVDPYIKAAIITFNVLLTQYQHGANKVRAMRAANK